MVSALPGSEQAPHSACTPSSSSSSSRRRHVLVTQGVSAGPSATLGGGGTAGSEVGQRSQEPPRSAGLCLLVFRALGAAVSPPHSSPCPNPSFTVVLPSQKQHHRLQTPQRALLPMDRKDCAAKSNGRSRCLDFIPHKSPLRLGSRNKAVGDPTVISWKLLS